MEENALVTSKDGVLDLSGEHSGGPFNKKMIIALVGALVLYFGISLIDMSAFGENCSKAAGFVLAIIWWMCFAPLKMSVAALIIATCAPLLGLIQFADVTTQLGKSSFYSLVGMLIVADGLRHTKFAERLSYWTLWKMGKKPVAMVIIITLVSAFLSSFLSSIAVIVIMSGICNALLLKMGETPGQSKIGRVLMALIPFAALYGGCALVNGSVNGNISSINYMMTASGDLAIEITYPTWAKLAFPAFVVCIFPATLIYISFFKLKNSDYVALPPEYYKGKLGELGKMGGSEARWIIITFGMIISMLAGMNTAHAALLWGLISLLPGIGVADAKKVIPNLAWDIILCVAIVPLLGTILSNNGVTGLIGQYIAPIFANFGPFAFMLISTCIMFILMNVMVNATHGAHALTATTLIPVAISLGYNPLVICFPMLLAGTWFFCIGANYIVMMNKGYGWWEMNDTILPGFVTGFFIALVTCVVVYFTAPMFGFSYYL